MFRLEPPMLNNPSCGRGRNFWSCGSWGWGAGRLNFGLMLKWWDVHFGELQDQFFTVEMVYGLAFIWTVGNRGVVACQNFTNVALWRSPDVWRGWCWHRAIHHLTANSEWLERNFTLLNTKNRYKYPTRDLNIKMKISQRRHCQN